MDIFLYGFAALSLFIAFKSMSSPNAGWKIWMILIAGGWSFIGFLYWAAHQGYHKQ